MRSLVPPLLAVCLAPSVCAQALLVEKFDRPATHHASFFGSYVAVQGDTALVGGRNTPGARVAYVYDRVGGDWVLGQTLLAGGSTSGPWATPVALDGDTALVSAMEAGGPGLVAVWNRVGGVWSRGADLMPSGITQEAHLGRRMALDGDRAAISVPLEETVAPRAGALLIFERSGGAWSQVQRLEAPTPAAFDFYGLGMDMAGDILAVGEPLASSVHFYRHDGGSFVLERTVQEFGGEFGRAVSVDGERIAVGDADDTSHGGTRGSVRLYERGGGSWPETDYLFTSSPDTEHFGGSVDLVGDQLAVGSGNSEVNGGSAVVLWRRVQGSWQVRATLFETGPGDHFLGALFGASVAIAGDDLWVGAPGEQMAPSDDLAGAAYAFRIGDLGASVCQPTRNSTGSAALILASGSTSIGANELTLFTGQVPDGPGLFFFGPNSIQVPFGNGLRCVGGTTKALPLTAATGGQLEWRLDLSDPGQAGTISAGSLLYFQAWFRDTAAGGAGFDLSDSLELRFFP